MRPLLLAGLVPLFALALAPRAANADSLSCAGGYVSEGDSKVDLLARCGEPTLVEARAEERTTSAVQPGGQVATSRTLRTTVETWTYNFGSQRFLQYVTLEAGRVVAVKSGGYGFDRGAAGPAGAKVPVARCDALRALNIGDSTFEILARCGEPATRDVQEVEKSLQVGDDSGFVQAQTSTSAQEIWTYNFGARAFTRRLVFRGGTLARVETLGYGYGQ